MTPLRGFTVAITAERRRDELGALLERRGARVVSAPAITIIPLLDDAALRAATVACVEHAPDVVVATTGIGFRGWLEAAEGWGVGEELRGGLGAARLIARGAKPCGAIRAAGLTEQWSAPTESCAEILDKLLAEGVAGRRIAVQLHGGPQDEFTTALRTAGAEVVEVPVYRWTAREDQEPLRRLVDQIIGGVVDAVTFTSAPAVTALLDAAGDGRAPAVLDAFRDGVLAACVGPVTAAPLRERDVPTLVPDRSRLGALVRAVTEALPSRARRLEVAGRTVELRGHAAIVDGEFLPLAPASMAVLRALAAQPGTVVSRARLASALPSGTQGAIDMAVARLRSSLGSADLIETVIKRGYRLRTSA
ncbi:uroporphyrinogen-III synthase [Asanoa hainanensis]|uniref:Uroporphyrinogen-III synthase n=1 Tax=Asanoa hainanensis TaxID=560556 RepID=A0A239IK12_9ACTN|nr:uroporphyrinogen-III synthase [Asanoa hainanensis]SNS93752.1 uroporphyrinogen-III synthase [Asanoa hainanensis]